MKRLKAFALMLLTVFLVFAPPGTLIFIALLIASYFGWHVATIIVVIMSCGIGGRWFVRNRRKKRADATSAE
jgi:hypothetical protein